MRGARPVDGCGCSGGGSSRRPERDGRGRLVHGNYSTGLWANTNDDGFKIQGNYFSQELCPRHWYHEISYNALIAGNTFVDNAWGTGAASSGFPTAPSTSPNLAATAAVTNSFGCSTLDIEGNTFADNWGGVRYVGERQPVLRRRLR